VLAFLALKQSTAGILHRFTREAPAFRPGR
jgi:hypothetical protein